MPCCLCVHCICMDSCFMYELLCNLYVKAYSVAAFLCRQHKRFFSFQIPGFALTSDIYSIMSLTAETQAYVL